MKAFEHSYQKILMSVAAFALLIIGSFAFAMWQSHTDFERRSGVLFSNMSLSLVELMDSHLRYAASALEEIDRDIYLGGGLEKVSAEEQHKVLVRLANLDKVVGHNLPFGSYFVVNYNGLSTSDSLAYPSASFNARDRDYFKWHEKMPGKQLHISKPVQSLLSGETAVIISRRLSSANGEFVGLIGVHFNLQYFNDFYRRLGLEGRAAIFLGNTDGEAIFRYPYTEQIQTKGISSVAVFQDVLKERSGWSTAISPYETGEEAKRIIGYRVSENFPILAIVSNTNKSVTDSWLQISSPQIGDILILLAGLAAMTFFVRRQLKLLEKLSVEASRDSLTNLYNRRELEKSLMQEWNRSRRNNSPISVLFLDIDFFKRFNDSLGHGEGDRCLKRIAVILQTEFRRAADITARIGGEEMLCLMTDTGAEEALRSAENLLEKIRKAEIRHPDSDVAKIVTVSIGVCTMIPQNDMAWPIIIENADRALYHAKQTGRNRISVWDETMKRHPVAH